MTALLVPAKAKLEIILPGNIAIYDISNLLPKPIHPRNNKRPAGNNNKSAINQIFFHHSGAYGKDGFMGAYNSVRYVIEKRNFGSVPYHFWLSRVPDKDQLGNIIIYRLTSDAARAWHTSGGKINDHAIGAVFQGNLHPGKTGKPSQEQYRMADALIDFLIEKYQLILPDALSFHSEANRFGGHSKPSCPGPYVEEYIKNRRNSI